MEQLQTFLEEHHNNYFQKSGVNFLCDNFTKGIETAKQLIYLLVDSKTVLFLSGGKTPQELYRQLAAEKKLQVRTVAMVDERPGSRLHAQSNERMIAETGLVKYLRDKLIPFYSILGDLSYGAELIRQDAGSVTITLEDKTRRYDEIIQTLFTQTQFNKRVGIFGIGGDGHTAGIPAISSRFLLTHPKFHLAQELVISHNENVGGVKGRISLSFMAMEQMDLLLVLVFGEDKKQALQAMFEKGSEDKVPARFFTRPEIASKTLIITDLRV